MPKTILITGASDGIGAAAARSLAAKGDRVLIVGRSASKTGSVAQETGAEPFVADFSRLDDVRVLAERVRPLLDGRLDVLANNAGMIKLMRSLGFSVKPFAEDRDFVIVSHAL